MWVTRVTKRVEISFRLLLYLAAERQILFFLPSHYFSFFFLLVLQYSTLLLLVLLDDIDQPKSTQCRFSITPNSNHAFFVTYQSRPSVRPSPLTALVL